MERRNAIRYGTEYHPCPGFPKDRECIVFIAGRAFCRDCETAALNCDCGGDANGPDHESSLLHRQWSWRESPPEPRKGLYRSIGLG